MSKLIEYFNGDNMAANIFTSKYKYKDEATPVDMHIRMAKELYRADAKYQVDETFNDKLSGYGKKRDHLSERSIFRMFDKFGYIVPQGSIMSQLGNNESIGSLSNCVTLKAPSDSYGSIMRADEEIVQLSKRRCGVGLDISNLRPDKARVTNSAKTSSGAVSFMGRYSHSLREVGQDGRRAAGMLGMDVRHPDISQFITVKNDDTSVTGANISVLINNEFMQAAEDDKDYYLRFPVTHNIEPFLSLHDNEIEYDQLTEIETGVYIKRVKAKKIWNTLIESAHGHAEPGLIYINNHWDLSPDAVYPEYKGDITNPCFRGDMKILTEDGYCPIGSLNKVDDLKIVNMFGFPVNGKVWSSGVKDIYEVKFYGGKKPLYVTKDHRIMLASGEEDIAVNLKGKRVMPYYKFSSHRALAQKRNILLQYGFLQGDGNLTRLNSKSHKGLEVNIGENDDDVLRIFRLNREKEGQRKFYIKGHNERLRDLGFSAKVLPERVMPTSYNEWAADEDRLAFLRGMFSANGSVIKGHRISYKTTSKVLSHELKNALSAFGIDSYITTNKKKNIKFSNGEYLCKESYDINISKYDSVLKFAEDIGFIHQYKNIRLDNLILDRAPKVSSVKYHSKDTVYDFSLNDTTHWGVVEGVVAHNCGEILMKEDSCRLMLLNLYNFVDNPFTDKASINYKLLYKMSYEQQRMLDDIIDLEAEKIDKIIEKVTKDDQPLVSKQVELNVWARLKSKGLEGRRTGGGITALGDMLAALGFKYDSEEALMVTDRVMKIKMLGELDSTTDMAITRGVFKGWDSNVENNMFFKILEVEFPEQYKRMQKYGRRNVSWSTVAPAGTTSIMTQTTSGIEPLFAPWYKRRRKLDDNSTERIDFVDKLGDKWTEYPVFHQKFLEWYIIKYGYKDKRQVAIDALMINASDKDLGLIFSKSPWYKSTANDIDWRKRIELQGVIQRYTSHSISSTINLPKGTTKDEVDLIYMTAWKSNVKGVTVYVDGSRDGVLITSSSTSESFQHNALKRPKVLDMDLYHSVANGKSYTVVVGKIGENPYEIFITEERFGKSGETGTIIKNGKGKYHVFVNDKELCGDLVKGASGEEETVARLLSASLRHGAEIKFLVEQLNKTKGELSSFSKVLARTLKRYIPEGATSTVNCEECGSADVVFEEGCSRCRNCGSSKCG